VLNIEVIYLFWLDKFKRIKQSNTWKNEKDGGSGSYKANDKERSAVLQFH
jgi:hypothetical protein